MEMHYHNLEGFHKALDIAKKKQELGIDSIFAFVGPERVGKSMLMLHGMDYLRAPKENVVMDAVESMKIIGKLEQFSAHQIDEAIVGAMARQSLSQQNINLIQIFSTVGKKNLIVFMGIPDFFLLDGYLRKFRLRGLFYVYRRSHVVFFGQRAIRKICLAGEKTHEIIGAKPYWSDTFPDYKGKLRSHYDKIETDWKNNRWNNQSDNQQSANSKEAAIKRWLVKGKDLNGAPLTLERIGQLTETSARYVSMVKRKFTRELS